MQGIVPQLELSQSNASFIELGILSDHACDCTCGLCNTPPKGGEE